VSERIYIQTGEDFEEDFRELNDEMTWSAERIYTSDIEYVRSDIYAAALARVARLEAALRMYADEKNWSDPMDDYGNPVGDVFFNPIGCGEPWEPARAALEPQP